MKAICPHCYGPVDAEKICHSVECQVGQLDPAVQHQLMGQLAPTTMGEKDMFVRTMRIGGVAHDCSVDWAAGLDCKLYLYQAAQVPSLETMHGPIGCTGEQAFPNKLHLSGVTLPWMTSPHRQPAGS